MQTTVYFIRHAPADSGAWHDQNRALTEQGKDTLGQVLASMEGISIDHFVSSSSPRAIDTIQPVAERLGKGIETFDELTEVRLRGRDYELADEDVTGEIKKVLEIPGYKLPGGVSRDEAEVEKVSKFKEIMEKYEGKTIVLGTHGMIMTIILRTYDESIGGEFWENISKPDVYKVVFEGKEMIKCKRIYQK